MNIIRYGSNGEFSSLEEWAEKTRHVPLEKIQEDWDEFMQEEPAATSVDEYQRWQKFLAVRYK